MKCAQSFGMIDMLSTAQRVLWKMRTTRKQGQIIQRQAQQREVTVRSIRRSIMESNWLGWEFTDIGYRPTRLMLMVFMIGALLSCVWLGRAYSRLTPEASAAGKESAEFAPTSIAETRSHGATVTAASVDRLGALHITVRPWGFEPNDITRPRGAFALRIDNRSGLGDVNVFITRETGEREADREFYRRKSDSLSYYNLTPGKYLLTDPNHREWSGRVTITAN